MKLSPYTIARNCTDRADLLTGIEELETFLKAHRNSGRVTRRDYLTALKRLKKIQEKLNKVQ